MITSPILIETVAEQHSSDCRSSGNGICANFIFLWINGAALSFIVEFIAEGILAFLGHEKLQIMMCRKLFSS